VLHLQDEARIDSLVSTDSGTNSSSFCSLFLLSLSKTMGWGVSFFNKVKSVSFPYAVMDRKRLDLLGSRKKNIGARAKS